MNVGTGAEVAEKAAIMRVTRNPGIVDPAIFPIMPPQPVLHAKFLSGFEVTDVNSEAAIKILRMNAFGPAIPEFLRHRASGELKPRPVEPDAELVFTRDPDHHWHRVHRFAKARIQATLRLGWNMRARFNHALRQLNCRQHV